MVPPHLNDPCVESALKAEQAELERASERTRSELDALREARVDASADDEHDPEGSTLASDWSRIEGIRSGLLARLGDNGNAFARLTDGIYGICARCGRTIGTERLEARPSAALCIDCARELRR